MVTPNPDVSPALTSPPSLPPKMPSRTLCQLFCTCQALRESRSAKLQFPQSSWLQRGQDFLVQPLRLIPCAVLCLPFSVRGCQPAHTQRLYPDPGGIRSYTVSEPTPPAPLPVLAFLQLRIEGSVTQGLSQSPLSAICLLLEVCPDLAACSDSLAALSNRPFCNDGDVLYLHCPTSATRDY